MAAKQSPKLTGISSITGKTVVIRHATEADMVFIAEYLGERRLDADDLRQDQFVVAAEDDGIIGFGRLKRTGDARDAGCISVVEKPRRRGIGVSIVKHLMDYAPLKTVYVTAGHADYVERLGFARAGKPQKKRPRARGNVCSVSGKPAPAVKAYEKR